MSQEIKTIATVTSWTEDSFNNFIPRFTQATCTLDLPSIKGTLTGHFFMIYFAPPVGAGREAGDVSFSSIDIIEAEDFMGKKGSFLILGHGRYTGATGEVKAEYKILPDNRTGELKDLKGTVTAKGTGNKDNPVEMEYVFSVECI